MTAHARRPGRRAKAATLSGFALALVAATLSCSASDAAETNDGSDAPGASASAPSDSSALPDSSDQADQSDQSDAGDTTATENAEETSKAASPGFLETSDLPQDPEFPWTADAVTAGLPESPPFCLEGLLPDGPATQHREFRTELTIYANQIIAVPGDESAAAELAALLDQAIERCASEYEEKYPGAIAEYRDYGTLSVEDGARVHGLHTSVPQGDSSVVLLAVGRDGDAVTVVRWSDMNDFDRAPVTEFQDTATAAVEGLY